MKPVKVNIKATNYNQKTGNISLMAVISYGASITQKLTGDKKPVQINVGLRGTCIPKSAWNISTHTVSKDFKDVRSRVERAKARLQEVCSYMLSCHSLNNDELKEFLVQDAEWCRIFNMEVKVIHKTPRIVDYIKHFMDTDTELEKGTLNGYNNIITKITALEEKNKTQYNFENFTITVFLQFVKSMNNLQFQTVQLIAGKLRAMFKRAEREGYKVGQYQTFIVKKEGHKAAEQKVRRLTDEAVKKLEGLELSGNMCLFRDAFLFECYTGIRVSDYTKVNRESVQKNDKGYYCIIKQTKTNTSAFILLDEKIMAILERWDYNLYNKRSYQNFYKDYNQGLHRLGEMIGEQETLTSHRGRHTFICKALEEGTLSESEIMLRTGHSSLEAFKVYAKPSDEKVIENLQKKIG